MSCFSCCFSPKRPEPNVRVDQRTPLLAERGNVNTGSNPLPVSSSPVIDRRSPFLGEGLNNEQERQLAHGVRTGDEAILHRFLGTKQRLPEFKDPIPEDIEGYYYMRLIQSKKSDLIEEQVVFLIKLADFYLKKREFLKAAKLLNGALHLASIHHKQAAFQNHLLVKLREIEELFLHAQGVKVIAERKISIHANRLRLKRIREEVSEKVEKKEPIQIIQAYLTEKFRELLKEMIFNAQSSIGLPPCNWACIGMGSMAREEMSLFSDVEFAFLLENETPQTLAYFRLVTQLLELQIVNLGETGFPIFAQIDFIHPSITPSGFSMDTGGNTPLGVAGIYELIGTPQRLALFVSEKWINRNIILANAMSCVCCIAGKDTLVSAYIHEKNVIFQQIAKKERTTREFLAYQLLEGHLAEFRPDLSKEKEKIKAFGIKKELYRPFQETLSCLALLYDLKANNSFERINELAEKGIFLAQGAENLKKAFSQVIGLRFQAHLFYKGENEYMCHPEEGKPKEKTLLYLSEESIKDLHEIYKVLLPFHKSAEEFFHTKSLEVLSKNGFYDDGPAAEGRVCEKTLAYPKAREAYQKAVSLDPNDIQALGALANMERRLGNPRDALQHELSVAEIMQRKFSSPVQARAVSFSRIGQSFFALADFEKALVYYTKALEVLRALSDVEFPATAMVLQHIANFEILRDYNKILEYLLKSLAINLQFYGEESLWVAYNYHNIGITYMSLGRTQKGLEYLEKALRIMRMSGGEDDPEVAATCSQIGAGLARLGKFSQALEFQLQAVHIRVKIFGEEHPSLIDSYTDICISYLYMRKNELAFFHGNKALEMCKRLHADDHPRFASCYIALGVFFEKNGGYDEAINYQQKALQSALKSFGERHNDVAVIRGHLGSSYKGLRNHEKALENGQKALEIFISIYGQDHPRVAVSYMLMGEIFYESLDFKQSIHYLELALDIGLRFKEEHTFLADCYEALALAWSALGKFRKALEYHQKSYEIRTKFDDKSSSFVATSLAYIGECYKNLGEFKKAFENLEGAFALFRVLPESSINVVKCYSLLGATYTQVGHYNKAFTFQDESLKRLMTLDAIGSYLDKARQKLNLQNSSSHTKLYQGTERIKANCWCEMGYTWQNIGDSKQALEYHQKALEIRQKIYGEAHPSVATSYAGVGVALECLGETEKALEHQQKALEIRLKILGEEHPDVAASYNCMAFVLTSMGEEQRARGYQDKALQILFNAYGEEHPDIATLYSDIATTCACFGDDKNALEYEDKALQLRLKLFGEEYPMPLLSHERLGIRLFHVGEFDGTSNHFAKAIEITLKTIEKEAFLESANDCFTTGFYAALQKDFGKALEQMRKFLSFKLKIYHADHRHIALSHEVCAEFMIIFKKDLEALDHYMKAVEILRKFSKGFEKSLAKLYHPIANVHAKLKNYAKAVEFLKKALEIEEKLPTKSEEDIDILRKKLAMANAHLK